jgi:hypothetical protein
MKHLFERIGNTSREKSTGLEGATALTGSGRLAQQKVKAKIPHFQIIIACGVKKKGTGLGDTGR